MSTQYMRFFFAWVMSVIIIFCGSFPCIGCLLEEEERPPLSHIQSLASDLEREKDTLHTADPSELIPLIEGFVATFLREQGFSVPSETKGPQSAITVSEELLLERISQVRRTINTSWPSSTSSEFLPDVINILASPTAFKQLVDNSAYALLLEKLRNEPTSLLFNFSLMQGMIVFCPHPQDIEASSEFLDLLYGSLTAIQTINARSKRVKVPLVPIHTGLLPIFEVFRQRSSDKKEVLAKWGMSLIGNIKQFYEDHRLFIKWQYIASVLEALNKDLTRKLALNAALPQEESSTRERRFSLLQEHKRAEAAYTLAEHFRSKGMSCFIPVNRTKTALFPLMLTLSRTPVSKDPSFDAIYTLFNKALEDTAYQVGLVERTQVDPDAVFTAFRNTHPIWDSLSIEQRLLLRKVKKNESSLLEDARAFEKTVWVAERDLRDFQEQQAKKEKPTEKSEDNEESTHALMLLSLQQRSELATLTKQIWTHQCHKAQHCFNHMQYDFRLQYLQTIRSQDATSAQRIEASEKKLEEAAKYIEQTNKAIQTIRRQAAQIRLKYKRQRQQLGVTPKDPFDDALTNPSFSEFFIEGLLSPLPDIEEPPPSSSEQTPKDPPLPQEPIPIAPDPRVVKLQENQTKTICSLEEHPQDTREYAQRALSAHFTALAYFQDVSFFAHPFIMASDLRDMISGALSYKGGTFDNTDQIQAFLITLRKRIETDVEVALISLKEFLITQRTTLSQTASSILSDPSLPTQDSSISGNLRTYYDGITPILLNPMEQVIQIFMKHLIEVLYRLYEIHLLYSVPLKEVAASLTIPKPSAVGTLTPQEQTLLTARAKVTTPLKRRLSQSSTTSPTPPLPIIPKVEESYRGIDAIPEQIRTTIRKTIRALPPIT